MAFDVQGALRAGHSEEDVAKYLAEKTGFDIEGARGAGYDTPAILDYTLNKLNANTPAPVSLAPGCGERCGNAAPYSGSTSINF